MSLSLTELSVYAFALFLLFLTPGPVWVALTARCLQSGFSGGWPLALGVAVGDCLWPLLALLTLTQFAQIYAELLESLRFLAVAVFLMLGVQLIRAPVVEPEAGGRLTQPGRLTGFIAGVLVPWLTTTWPDVAAYHAYETDPIHLEVRNQVIDLMETAATVDYTVADR